MFYLLTTNQVLDINTDLSGVGEPPIVVVPTGDKDLNRITYESFTDTVIKKYQPYTANPMPPNTTAIVDSLVETMLPTSAAFDALATGGGGGPHDHDTQYSQIGHAHIHDHDTEYSPVSHTHVPGPHDHDTLYSQIIHNHDPNYVPLTHLTDPDAHTNTVLAPFTFTMEGNGMSGNWFTAATRSGIPSHLAPGVAIANCILIAAMFSNEIDNANFQIDFYVDYGVGVSPSYTWNINGARYGYKINDDQAMPPDLYLAQGSRLSLRVGTVTTTGKDAFCILYFALTDSPPPSEFFSPTL